KVGPDTELGAKDRSALRDGTDRLTVPIDVAAHTELPDGAELVVDRRRAGGAAHFPRLVQLRTGAHGQIGPVGEGEVLAEIDPGEKEFVVGKVEGAFGAGGKTVDDRAGGKIELFGFQVVADALVGGDA